jgi:hypothetical protein
MYDWSFSQYLPCRFLRVFLSWDIEYGEVHADHLSGSIPGQVLESGVSVDNYTVFESEKINGSVIV